jgi:hypothetical protein
LDPSLPFFSLSSLFVTTPVISLSARLSHRLRCFLAGVALFAPSSLLFRYRRCFFALFSLFPFFLLVRRSRRLVSVRFAFDVLSVLCLSVVFDSSDPTYFGSIFIFLNPLSVCFYGRFLRAVGFWVALYLHYPVLSLFTVCQNRFRRSPLLRSSDPQSLHSSSWSCRFLVHSPRRRHRSHVVSGLELMFGCRSFLLDLDFRFLVSCTLRMTGRGHSL